QRPAYLRFSTPTFLEERTPGAPAVFHEGLIKDHEGVYWIVKKFNPRARDDRNPRDPRNSPRYEMLAYLLARGRANYAEIRFLSKGEIRDSKGLRSPLRDYYLTRVVTSMNLTPASLPHQNPA